MDYIVKVNYYDWDGMPKYNSCYVIDDAHTFYEAKDSEGKVKELIGEINKIEDDAVSRVDINVYELGNKVTDKFI
nr:MAG TPA: hypothetical protein [Bacteriophage sp.]